MIFGNSNEADALLFCFLAIIVFYGFDIYLIVKLKALHRKRLSNKQTNAKQIEKIVTQRNVYSNYNNSESDGLAWISIAIGVLATLLFGFFICDAAALHTSNYLHLKLTE